MDAREKASLEDHSYMFKKIANPNPLTYDDAPNPKAFKDWILLSQEKSEDPSPLHLLAISLLKRFHHLFPEEIPSELPPKRDIQNHIDLI